MLLRSSSTPVLGSLVSSIAADSPNNNNHYHETSSPFRHYPSSSFHGNRLSFHPSPGSVHLSTVASCGSSPISPSVVDQSSDFELKGFRRAQSDGNLEGLAYSARNGNDEFYNQNHPKKLPARNKCLMLQTIPSFSFYNSGARREEEDESDFEGEEEEEMEENEEKVTAALNGSSHGFNSISLENLSLNEKVEVTDEKGLVGVEMFLPIGVEAAMDGGNRSGGGWGGGGGEFNSAGSNGDGEIEEYYKRMVKENPGNAIFLRNYAQFLYQSKRDLQGAEEYYSRAILADPKDGETLSQYAKLVWELHRNEERASSYFERAVQASPQDCHVQAAYASFLWETEEDGDECAVPSEIGSIPGALASA
ncbi:Tetratricopeptide repeat-like superfamily protein, putative isoform 2 [Hibiscus syriacus]|uniref:Tetratricopeptide repeat-like superfamily protein, putative isoform 2 n=1 Tax=Hibiscus syriacus TaxID=106335 RepID=A0A6A3AIV3_HIBSY|nr:uncharacterized protein LOC120126899 [Hibiscus syriacus]KAE8703998.1 Tetratricopeptide repeat-like superfamily protein, putative isoform 2 [Hibiscus syriacus]